MSALLFTLLILCGDGAIPVNTATLEVQFEGVKLELFTYKPETYRDGPLIMVFHGVLRNAEEYRDHAKQMGDRYGALIVAPRFPEPEFPIVKYQQGGLLIDGKATPRASWTWSFIPLIAAEIRRREDRPQMPYYLIGHSGGGQFLVRLAGFLPTDASRIVVANPGTHLFPTTELPYPWGFGGLPEELCTDETLQRYLAQPLTIYLGKNDTERDEYFDVTPNAEKQGMTRYQRGQHAFQAAAELARRREWKFNWRLVEVTDVGHDHQAMFNNPQCDLALFGAPQLK